MKSMVCIVLPVHAANCLMFRQLAEELGPMVNTSPVGCMPFVYVTIATVALISSIVVSFIVLHCRKECFRPLVNNMHPVSPVFVKCFRDNFCCSF